ncbi:GntR family transcriptional regulator [Microbacterium gorillae]|uniref:GntR family transcriptional regulator n=1 Tax=Microbacterium gorillae TaxID=1231063 RepID=UPI00058E621F|nr:GntR family transcriptional regulator [Microbacterium gorillae]
MSAPTLGVVTVVDAVTADLRTRILAGDLEPGRPLGEVDTAAHYGVARPTVRAAIEALVSAGLLTRGTHKSARVTVLTADDIADVYTTREHIESEVVRQLALAAAVVPDADAANDAIRALADAPAHEVVDLDMRFHLSLIDAVGSIRTSRIYGLLADEMRLCMSRTQRADLLSVADITAEHAALLSRIAAGDAEGAVSVLREHLGRARTRLVAHVAAGG